MLFVLSRIQLNDIYNLNRSKHEEYKSFNE